MRDPVLSRVTWEDRVDWGNWGMCGWKECGQSESKGSKKWRCSGIREENAEAFINKTFSILS